MGGRMQMGLRRENGGVEESRPSLRGRSRARMRREEVEDGEEVMGPTMCTLPSARRTEMSGCSSPSWEAVLGREKRNFDNVPNSYQMYSYLLALAVSTFLTHWLVATTAEGLTSAPRHITV